MADNNGNQNNSGSPSSSILKKVGKIGLSAPPDSTRTIGRSSQINFQEGQEGLGFSVGEDRGHSGQIEKQVTAAEVNAGTNIARKQEEPKKPGIIQKAVTGTIKYSPAGIAARVISSAIASPSKEPAPQTPDRETEAFSPADGTDTANTADALLRMRSKQQETASPTPSQQTNTKVPSKPNPLVRGTKKTLIYTSPGGFIIGKLAPRIRERFFAKKEVENVEKEAKKQSKKGRTVGKWLFYTTPTGLLFLAGKKFLPQNVKTRLRKLFPKGTTSKTEDKAQKQKKTAKEYQRAWNNSTLGKALQKGYDRFALLRKVRDMKIWKSRGWKIGKYALGVIPAAGYDIHQWQKGRKAPESQEQRENESTTQHRKASGHGFIRGNSGIWDGKLLKYSPAGMGINAWKRFGSPRMGGLNRGMGRRFGGMGGGGIKNTAKAGVKNVGGKVLKKTAEQLTLTFLKTPPGWITMGVAAFIIFMVSIVMALVLNSGGNAKALNPGGGGGTNPGNPGGTQPPSANPIPNFTITKTVDKETAAVGEPIIYTITYSYAPAAGATIKLSDITIYDKLPGHTSFSGVSGNGSHDSSTNTVSWNLSGMPDSGSLTLTVTAVDDNVLITNTAFATAASSSSGGGNTAPTADNCNGAYNLTNPIGNFGDTSCYFASNKAQAMSDLYDLLKAQDPANADGWYNKVVPCETGGTYSPNSYRPQHLDGADDTPDPNGAWGLFQMSMNNYNGQYDMGAVPWKNQIENAVGYGKRVTASNLPLGAYWACWR